MRARAPAIALLAALCAALPAPTAASTVSAGAGAAHVWTDNVFGTEPSPSDGITDGRGWLAWRPAARWRLAASGRLLRFDDNQDLNHGYVMLAAEATPGPATGALRWQVGAAGTWRLNGDLYEPFNYRDAGAYVSARRQLSPEMSAQARVDGALRDYPGQPNEDSRKAWLSLRLQRSLPTRTSLTLSGRTGWKQYVEGAQADAAVREFHLQAAQSVSGRVALRAWGATSHLFEHGDAAEQMAAFDNPLLDEFSFDGRRLGGAVKVILPWNLVADLSGERAWLDYPGRPPALYDPAMNRFVVDGKKLVLDDGQRQDATTRARLSLERRGARFGDGSRLDVTASAEWSEQQSNDLYWQWRGWSFQAGASIEF